MEAARIDSDQHIIRLNGLAGDQVLFLNNADAETGKVILAFAVLVRHDGGFTSEEGTVCLNTALADSLNDLLQQRWVIV